jgi:hypothetical protein
MNALRLWKLCQRHLSGVTIFLSAISYVDNYQSTNKEALKNSSGHHMMGGGGEEGGEIL